MVACVIVNWNGWRDTIACLRTLKEQTAPLEVIVVDNGSTNDSVAQIKAFLAATPAGSVPITLVEHPENVGFGRGTNIGIRIAKERGAEFAWLLNNDTECPPDTLAKLLRVANEKPDTGIVGTVLYYHHDPSQVQAWSGGRISRWLGTSLHYTSPQPQVPGSYTTFASALVRMQVLDEIGMIYEGFFMYYEDSELCMRMEHTPWKIAVAADTKVLHKEGASTGEARNPFMEKTIAVSGMLFLRMHSPMFIVSLPLFLAIKLLNRARRGEWAAFRAVLRAVAEFQSTPMVPPPVRRRS
ncbi:putative glycosyltransferase [Terriglobus roseus DSM 18391]|uniref:Putative glycosyltransferase n=1 Tax=Terriglobus roseus (strain DSM 18391 / NRRL B-41598 / KBS 63) TaxID=926566 RepID=I3ZBE3_TERRK|nr:glycosyltransferase family 2 protein [Terriglobus roseus]AFL86561.1 putative glycosyltransferase [Terriglobus roseus DSM 18391]